MSCGTVRLSEIENPVVSTIGALSAPITFGQLCELETLGDAGMRPTKLEQRR
jgi:hypothetical protein